MPATRLPPGPARRGDLDELRARAGNRNSHTAEVLLDLLAERGELDECCAPGGRRNRGRSGSWHLEIIGAPGGGWLAS